MEFNTVSISDGISMGAEGMKCSLISRDERAFHAFRSTILNASGNRDGVEFPSACTTPRGCPLLTFTAQPTQVETPWAGVSIQVLGHADDQAAQVFIGKTGSLEHGPRRYTVGPVP